MQFKTPSFDLEFDTDQDQDVPQQPRKRGVRLKSVWTGNILEVTPPKSTLFSPYAIFTYMMPSKCAIDGPFAQVNAIESSKAAISTPQFVAHPASFRRLQQVVMPTYDGTDKKLWPQFAEARGFLWDCQHSYDFSSCFFPKFKKSAKRGFSR